MLGKETERRNKREAQRFYLPELDVLRFFAFFAVFICHGFPHTAQEYASQGVPGFAAELISSVARAGAYGVDLFFLLSSYLITSLLIREEGVTGRIDVRAFWIRRCLRIWPLYFAFVIVAGLLLPNFFGFVPGLAARYIVGLLSFTHNWVLAFSGVGKGSPTLILWSVSLEEQFYLAWPIVIACAGIRRLRGIAICMIGASIVGRVIAIAAGASKDVIWCATPLRMEPIAMGALLALFSSRLPNLDGRLRAALLCVGVLVPVAFHLPGLDTAWVDAVKLPVTAAACGLILVSVLGAGWPVLQFGPLVYLGKISYGLYVFHLLAIQFSPHLGLPDFPFGRSIIAFGITVGVAVFSYRFLELPFLRLKERFALVQSRPA